MASLEEIAYLFEEWEDDFRLSDTYLGSLFDDFISNLVIVSDRTRADMFLRNSLKLLIITSGCFVLIRMWIGLNTKIDPKTKVNSTRCCQWGFSFCVGCWFILDIFSTLGTYKMFSPSIGIFLMIYYSCFLDRHGNRYVATISSMFLSNGWTIIFMYTLAHLLKLKSLHEEISFGSLMPAVLSSIIFIFETESTSMNKKPSFQVVAYKNMDAPDGFKHWGISVIEKNEICGTLDLHCNNARALRKLKDLGEEIYIFKTLPDDGTESWRLRYENLYHTFPVALLMVYCLWNATTYRLIVQVLWAILFVTFSVWSKLKFRELQDEEINCMYNQNGDCVREYAWGHLERAMTKLEDLSLKTELLCYFSYIAEVAVLIETLKQ